MFRKIEYRVAVVREKPMLVENHEAVLALRGHPGWEYQMQRLRLQRQYLETKLSKTKHKDIREVDFLQAGIAWLSYLEEDMAKATESVKPVQVEPVPYDVAAEFEKIDSFIERVGSLQD